MNVLCIGGSGTISSAVVTRALDVGHRVYAVTRGQSTRSLDPRAEAIVADVRNAQGLAQALAERYWDVVIDFLSFVPENIETILSSLGGRFGQYIFISSASAYRKPSASLPVTESQALDNPYWEYSRNKIACERYVMDLWTREGVPFTIVRPSHTYDPTRLPMAGRWTVVDLMLRGKPVVVHGDGTSLWTLTHHRDFALALVGLLNHPHSIGEAFHITNDEWLSWNQIFDTIAAAVGTRAKKVHVPSEVIHRFDPEWGDGLLGDKAHSMVFDNSKVKRLVPSYRPEISFGQGIKEVVQWFWDHPQARQPDQNFLTTHNKLLAWAQREV